VGAAKIITCHLAACRQCQQFSKPNPLAVPGYSVSPKDVFSYWPIDFADPFPGDFTTGAKYAILAVDWLSRWAEGEPTKEASPETTRASSPGFTTRLYRLILKVPLALSCFSNSTANAYAHSCGLTILSFPRTDFPPYALPALALLLWALPAHAKGTSSSSMLLQSHY